VSAPTLGLCTSGYSAPAGTMLCFWALYAMAARGPSLNPTPSSPVEATTSPSRSLAQPQAVADLTALLPTPVSLQGHIGSFICVTGAGEIKSSRGAYSGLLPSLGLSFPSCFSGAGHHGVPSPLTCTMTLVLPGLVCPSPALALLLQGLCPCCWLPRPVSSRAGVIHHV
jgi:hypothetical protein